MHGLKRVVSGSLERCITVPAASEVWRPQSRHSNKRARVLSALARRLPLKKGRAGTKTHDYKRHGTTTLFAALNVLVDTVIGRQMQRHRHQEFIRLLNAVEAAAPAAKVVHVILDNYAAHRRPRVRKCSAGI